MKTNILAGLLNIYYCQFEDEAKIFNIGHINSDLAVVASPQTCMDCGLNCFRGKWLKTIPLTDDLLVALALIFGGKGKFGPVWGAKVRKFILDYTKPEAKV